MAQFTEDEAELYDRQIRLWGLDAQKRMRTADVLVVGLSGLAAEIIKNIVLAGINSLTLLDDQEVNTSHMSAQFFVNKDQIGEKVAEAALSSIRKLNPLVKVTADVDRLSNKVEDYFTKFHVICLTCCDRRELIRVDEICRRRGIKFFCGAVFGFYGYMFSDLLHHEYAEEQKMPKVPDGPPNSKLSKPDPSKQQEMEIITVKKSCDFQSFESAISMDFSEIAPNKLKKISSVFFITKIIMDFIDNHSHKPSAADQATLEAQCEETLQKLGVSSELVPAHFARLACCAELSPVCAIVGGVLAQEILKAVSQKDAPINNYFFYDPDASAGIVESIHCGVFADDSNVKHTVEVKI